MGEKVIEREGRGRRRREWGRGKYYGRHEADKKGYDHK